MIQRFAIFVAKKMEIDTLHNLAVHKVGNKGLDEYLFLGKQKLKIDGKLNQTLTTYFLSSFKDEEYFHFHHDISLSHNEVYSCVREIFQNPETLQEQSENIATHLYNESIHPKIKGGELYVAYFKDMPFDGKFVDAVGLFKSETRETFLEVEQIMEGFEVESREGININKLDKGCLIFNTEEEEGYVLSIVDNTNKSSEAQYWRDKFLGVIIINNDFHQTNQFLSMAKLFVTKQLPEDFEVSKTDRIDYLNRSVDYFKTNETFDKAEFEEQVFGHENVIESFRKFDNNFRQQNEIEVSDQFGISASAVKKQARVFKSVLKLDKNFHIYIHGNRELIEQGVDELGRKFYKIYYEVES